MVDASVSTRFTGKRRYLSLGETYGELGSNCSPSLSSFINVTIFNSNQPVPQDIVKESLSVLISRHDLLKSKVKADVNQDLFFETINELPKALFPLRFEKINEINDWVPYINEELENGFNEFVWKAVWLEIASKNEKHKYVLVFTCSHAVIDGRGGFDIIANQFTAICNALLNHSQIDLLPSPIPCVKSMEDIFMNMTLPVSQQPVNWFIKSVVDFGLWMSSKLFSKPTVRTHDVCLEDNNRHDFYPFTVDEELTKSFISCCKENNVTVHSALLVLTSCILETTRASYPEFKKKIGELSYPIDLRKFVNELHSSPMPCGTYVFFGNQTLKPFDVGNRNFFFDVAKKVNENVKKQNKSTIAPWIWSLLNAFVKNSTLTYEEKLGCLLTGTSIPFSNIGNCDVVLATDNQSPLCVEGHYFTVAIPGGFYIGTLTVRRRMCFCIAYSGKWISKEFVTDFSTNFVKAVEKICDKAN